jgi:hypothetical protein
MKKDQSKRSNEDAKLLREGTLVVLNLKKAYSNQARS